MVTIATHLAPTVRPAYTATVEHLAKSLGISAGLKTGRNYSAVFEDADAAFICGYPYVVLKDKLGSGIELLGAPVLLGDRYEDRPVYFSDVIVSASSEAATFEDLKGVRWAYNEPMSHSGYNVVRHHMARLNLGSEFFAEVVESGFHQESVQMVASGRVDASAIDSQVLEVEMLLRPRLADQIKVIDTIGPSTIQPIVASSRLGESMISDLREALLSMHEDEQKRQRLRECLIDRWVAIEDGDYDDIREMARFAISSGYERIS